VSATPFRLLAAGLLCAAWLLPASADDEKTDKKPNPAAKAAPRPDQWWQDRHEKFLAQTKKGGIEVAFLGDSITQGWEKNGKEAWKKTFAPMKAGNYGIGGDQTQHVLWRITEGKELDGIDPKAAVIMIGTNNMGTKQTPEQIAGGVEAIVKQLRKDKPKTKVLLLAIFPRASPREVGKEATRATAAQLNQKVQKTNALLKKLGDDKHVFYKDIGGKFLDKEGGLPKAIMYDYLHLTPKGYQIWADAIKADVEKLTKE
jgi:lysophospholipase L1-like esterase